MVCLKFHFLLGPVLICIITGDITYINLLGSDVLVVNSRSTLSTLFEKKGSNFSDRPSLFFACDLVGWKDLPAMLSIGPEHTNHRRLMAQTIGTKALISDMQEMVNDQVFRFLRRTIAAPERLSRHLRT
jgi:hypothetical protein